MKQFTTLLFVITSSCLVGRAVAFVPSVRPDERPVIKAKVIGLPSPQSAAPVTKNEPNTVIIDEILKPVKTMRKKWGVDNEHPNEYWFDDRIHVFGNHGFWGAVHAALAPLSTKILDVAAYDGVNIRQRLAEELSASIQKKKARVVDLCCGTGFSTRALHEAFPEAETVVGIDTSAEMIAMAEFLTKHIATVQPVFDRFRSTITEQYKDIQSQSCLFESICYSQSNAEDTKLPDRSFDLVTVMWAFHEAPLRGREKIIAEARRLLSPGGTLAVVDISSDYVPSETMLKGEPYVQEYQQNIHKQLQESKGFNGAKYRTIVPNHLGMWTLTRSALA